MVNIPMWNPALSVGNLLIDEQHQRLLAVCHHAASDLDERWSSSETFHMALNDFAQAFFNHLNIEEYYLAKNHCPNLASHKAEHDAYRGRLFDLMFQAAEKKCDRAALLTLMEDCANHHLLGADMDDREFLRAGVLAAAVGG